MKNQANFKVGYHNGAFHSAYFSFDKTLIWAKEHGIHNIECGMVDGVTWNHGLGYFPHVASWEDPLAVKDKLAEHDVLLSQIDAAFPISGLEGPSIAVPYIQKTIRWAAQVGCPMVDTTDGLFRPEGLTDREAMDMMRRSYTQVLDWAERCGIVINIETHGYFTGNPEYLEEMLSFSDSPLLRLNYDFGNVFIAGQDPVEFMKLFIDKISHLHIKDVAPELSESSRGKQFGIGMSHCAVGEGVNRDNIRTCFELLRDHGFRGNVSIECDAAGGPVMERSIRWVYNTLNALGIEHDIETLNSP